MSNIEKQRLLNLIKMHQTWIKSNSFDYEGVKERKQWINECKDELEQLECQK